jgi:hypothetical protein
MRASRTIAGEGYETSLGCETVTFVNGMGVYDPVFHVCEWLCDDNGRGRTTSGNSHVSSGRRAGSQPANGTTPGICGTHELLGERENHPGISA